MAFDHWQNSRLKVLHRKKYPSSVKVAFLNGPTKYFKIKTKSTLDRMQDNAYKNNTIKKKKQCSYPPLVKAQGDKWLYQEL